MDPIKQRSRGLFYVIGIFLIIMIGQVFIYGNFIKDLQQDREGVNDLSMIRGEIQRYTKLGISDFDMMSVETQALGEVIDALFIKYRDRGSTGTEQNDLSRDYEIDQLEMKWAELKKRIKTYQTDPTEANLFAVIGKSEECWGISDANVIQQQFDRDKNAAYAKYFTLTFGINLFIIILILLLYKRFIHNTLSDSAVNDALTGIFNKGYFDEYLSYEIARALRKQRPFSLIMYDIDHFKIVNDTYGHRRGDSTLKTLTEVVQKCKRNADVIARIGGEEFIILLPDTTSEDAFLLATRIRKTVEDYPFEEIGRLTISLGITDFVVTDSKDTLLGRVDAALYKAKENGRNRCELIEG